MKKKEINRALKISVLFASIFLVFTSFKSSISSLSLTIQPVAEAASPTTTAGTCRDDPCPGEESPQPPATCKPGPGQMIWPKTGKCVPQNCQKSGFTMVRNATGNCVPSNASCEDVGAKRDVKGNCVPKIETEKKSKQERTGGNNAGNGSTSGDTGAGIQGGSKGVTKQGGMTGSRSGTGSQIVGGGTSQQGSTGGDLTVDSEKATQGSKILAPTEDVSSPDDPNTSETEISTGGSQKQLPQLPRLIPGDNSSSPQGGNPSTLGSNEQSTIKKEAETQMLENNNNIMNLGSAKRQYLSAWNLTEFGSGFDTFIEPGSAKGYGIYEETNSQTLFMPRKTIELYLEPVGFGYKPIIDKKGGMLYQINFTANALVFDKQGNQTAGVSHDIPVVISHNKNTEQYLTIPINQEDNPLSGGDYVIRYFITDGSNGETIELAKKNIKISLIIVSTN